jgi:hypothetical protein
VRSLDRKVVLANPTPVLTEPKLPAAESSGVLTEFRRMVQHLQRQTSDERAKSPAVAAESVSGHGSPGLVHRLRGAICAHLDRLMENPIDTKRFIVFG